MIYQKISLADAYPFLGEDGKDPVLSAYLADNLAEMNWDGRKHPCILICPGGAYRYCSLREQEPIALAFLPAGYHVFVLNYSVAPHRYPTQLVEVAAALEVIHANAEKWYCDVDHIAIMGFSAGGHLAAHYSNAYAAPQVRQVFPQSKPVFATVLGYPVITGMPPYAGISTANLLGEDEPRLCRAVSCDTLVSEDTPPTFIWHTSPDRSVPVQHSLMYATALAEHKIPFALRIYHAGDHGLATVDDQTCNLLTPDVRRGAAWIPDAQAFLRDMMQDR